MTKKQVFSANLLGWTFTFWLKHLGIITFLMLFAAVGRSIQMRAMGEVSSTAYFWLEVMVEVARLLALFAIVGHGHIVRGFLKIGVIFRLRRDEWSEIGRSVRATLRFQWPALVGYLVFFSLIALLINKGNSLIADNTTVLTVLKRSGLLHPAATGMPLFFFLKNLTIIPLTLVFEYNLLQWCTKQGRDVPIAAN